VGNKKRSTEDIIKFHVGRGGNEYFQEGNEMGSDKDLIYCEEGKNGNSNFQVGKENEMRLFESLINSEESSYQQEVSTKEEDQRHIIIIGGINIFFPSNPIEANAHVEGAIEERQPTKTIMEN
jgi:hypothetical protein